MGLLVLKKGVSGHEKEVRILQELLNHKVVPGPNLPVTGHFGDQTHKAVESFQKSKGLKPDGIVGPNTWTALGQPMPTSGNIAAGLPGQITIQGVDKLSPNGERVLKEILQAAGLTSARVTSGYRGPFDQARVMYDNIVSKGVAHQKQLYNGKPGVKVIEVYEANSSKAKDAIIAAMKKKIEEIGPAKVSKHGDPNFDVFDVAPSSIKSPAKFLQVLKEKKKSGLIFNYLKPPQDPAYHIEVRKNLGDFETHGVEGLC